MQAVISPWGEDGPEVTLNLCDVCGKVWIQETAKEPERCAARNCHTALWNRERRSHRGRPDAKNEQRKRESKLRPISDVEGRHHALCPCLECLSRIPAQGVKAYTVENLRRMGRKRGLRSDKGKSVRHVQESRPDSVRRVIIKKLVEKTLAAGRGELQGRWGTAMRGVP